MNDKKTKTALVFLAQGFEEIEGLTAVDVLRRAGVAVTTVAIPPYDAENPGVVDGAHHVPVRADILWEEMASHQADWLILPGGLPGSNHLAEFTPLIELLKAQMEAGRGVAAICAAPAFVLGTWNMLKGRSWTGYPGCEQGLTDTHYRRGESVVVDANLITGEGPAKALPWALTIAQAAVGEDKAREVASAMLY